MFSFLLYWIFFIVVGFRFGSCVAFVGLCGLRLGILISRDCASKLGEELYQWVLDGLWHWNLGMISGCLLDLGYLTVWVVWTLCV